jgi:hypothetical protein
MSSHLQVENAKFCLEILMYFVYYSVLDFDFHLLLINYYYLFLFIIIIMSPNIFSSDIFISVFVKELNDRIDALLLHCIQP